MDYGKLIGAIGNRSGGRRRLFGLLALFLTAILMGSPGVRAEDANAITDLLKGGAGSSGQPSVETAPAPIFTLPGLEPRQGAAPVAVPQTLFETAAPAGQGASETLTYDGQAAGDGRRARIDLTFDGVAVEGTIWIQSVCENNFHLGGADLTLQATLSGVWESKEGSIDGTWEGTEHFCGSDMPNHGTLKFFLKDDGYFDPVLHLRLTGERGQYGWNFPPKGQVFFDGGASAKAPTAADDKDPEQGGDDGDTKGPVPEDEIDPDKVTDLILLPGLMAMAPGESAELPFVQAVIGDEANRVFVPDSALQWGGLPPGPLEIRDGKFLLSETAKDREEIPFEVTVTLGDLQRVLTGKVRVYAKEQLGSISGWVTFVYKPSIMPYPDLDPRSAEVELHSGTGLGTPIGVTMTDAAGNYRFDNLPKGLYVTGVRKLDPPKFPAGYVLDTGSAPWRSMTVSIPDDVFVEEADEVQVVWDRRYIGVEAKVVQPPSTDGAIYGRVHYQDKGIEGVSVLARQVGSTGVVRSVTSGKDGFYLLKIDDLPGGTYWITAEKYVTPRWAGPDDLLDTSSTRFETPILVSNPLSDPRGIGIDIELDTRIAIFGGTRTPVEPISLPGEE